MYDQVRLFPSQQETLKYVSTCEKRAFAGTSAELENFSELFRKNGVKFGAGNDKFYSKTIDEKIPQVAGEYLHRRMAEVMSSGLYQLWERIFYCETRDQLDPKLKTVGTEDKQKLE